MSTLIIHPKDHSTQFLDIVYRDISDATVITGGISKSDMENNDADLDNNIIVQPTESPERSTNTFFGV